MNWGFSSSLLLWVSLLMAQGEAYEEEEPKGIVVVTCPFGSGPGEVGVDTAKMLIGPLAFTADKEGSIYICDIFNSRTLKFDSTGRLVWTMDGRLLLEKKIQPSGASIGSLFVAPDGKVYFYSAQVDVVYDSLFNPISSLTFEERRQMAMAGVGQPEHWSGLATYRKDKYQYFAKNVKNRRGISH